MKQFTAFILFILGCFVFPPSAFGVGTRSFLPLEEGTQWVYRSEETDYELWEVVEGERGEDAFVLQTRSLGLDVTRFTYRWDGKRGWEIAAIETGSLKRDEQGELHYGKNGDRALKEPLRFLPADVREGQEWDLNGSWIDGYDACEAKALPPEEITVPAVKMYAHLVRFRHTDSSGEKPERIEYVWFAPRVGMLKMMPAPADGTRPVTHLAQYEPADDSLRVRPPADEDEQASTGYEDLTRPLEKLLYGGQMKRVEKLYDDLSARDFRVRDLAKQGLFEELNRYWYASTRWLKRKLESEKDEDVRDRVESLIRSLQPRVGLSFFSINRRTRKLSWGWELVPPLSDYDLHGDSAAPWPIRVKGWLEHWTPRTSVLHFDVEGPRGWESRRTVFASDSRPYFLGETPSDYYFCRPVLMHPANAFGGDWQIDFRQNRDQGILGPLQVSFNEGDKFQPPSSKDSFLLVRAAWIDRAVPLCQSIVHLARTKVWLRESLVTVLWMTRDVPDPWLIQAWEEVPVFAGEYLVKKKIRPSPDVQRKIYELVSSPEGTPGRLEALLTLIRLEDKLPESYGFRPTEWRAKGYSPFTIHLTNVDEAVTGWEIADPEKVKQAFAEWAGDN